MCLGQSVESLPIEPLASQRSPANQIYNYAIILKNAYGHTPSDEETFKLTNFSSGDKLFAFMRSFMDLKAHQTSLQNICFRSLILS